MLSEELRRFIQNEKNIGMEFVKQAQKCERSIYLYGAGYNLRFAMQFMRKYEIKIKAILDTYQEGVYQDIPIIRFSEFMNLNPSRNSWFVISAPSVIEEITEILADHFPKENIFSFEMQIYTDYIQNVEEYRQYLLEHWQELSNFSDGLADNRSRETLDNVLRGRISGERDYFRRCFEPNQYYPEDIIRFSDGEVMVELGANDGETLMEFMRLCPRFQTAYCFEPDTNCLPGLNDIAKSVRGGGTIRIIPKGAWDCATVLEFCSDGECVGDAHILSEHGETAAFRIETAAVDEEVDEPISFMKMDIEGAELQALHGAERQICKNRPKLAICVYHKIDDILNIWNYLRELVPEYRFYLRHHTFRGATDTLLYAVID